ncbi:toxin-activating lysine-acyltransferase [Halocynthiibacter sp. C4]|uniref:toxin-activating lysine-acyltransferase n=1 Tax=Halocynthiibacter sp. C4 TaxID=2992758 RepID=UPI00237A7498|nr:toxin-activating lysine-acyltransferase [Halocynthiibacter sp. C4]MDE0588847.1 toxin-activating lysine-acyltransferase [Halocynthiibacter sp. C4]
MSKLQDSAGRDIPASEAPSAETLRIYGDFMFLAFRSPWHARMSVANMRAAFEQPIALKQFQVFRFDGIPRGLLTWANMSADAERRYVSGEILKDEDWSSGDRRWIIDIIAPYKGLTASISRWTMVPGQFTDGQFRFRRVLENSGTRRIVEVDLTNPKDKATIFTEEEYLEQL